MNQELNILDYNEILNQIIAEIKSTWVVIANRVNNSMIQMYWNIGKNISEKGLKEGYGGNVVKRLSVDLKSEFPRMSGFSPLNLWDTKCFFEFYSQEDVKLRQAIAVFDEDKKLPQVVVVLYRQITCFLKLK